MRELVRAFAGQTVSAARFGRPAHQRITLPHVSAVEKLIAEDPAGIVRGRPSEVEVDLHFGEDAHWLAEIKDRGDRASEGDVRTVAAVAAFLRQTHGIPAGPTWFVSVNGFTDAAKTAAREADVLTSTLDDLEGLRNDIATRRIT